MNQYIAENKYITLINNCKNREINNYTENHHIIPKCMGGKETIALTVKEHVKAHELLMYMTFGKLSEARKKQKAPVPKGTKLSEKHKEKIGKANKGVKNGMYGKVGPFKGCKHTKESRKKISKAGKGRIVSKETRKKLSDAAINQWLKQRNLGGD